MTAKPDSAHIGLVLEGPGDKDAVPLILRRHLQNNGNYEDILGKPLVLKGRGSATKADGIEGFAKMAARPGCRGLLIFVDADEDKSCELGPSLLVRAESVVSIPITIVVAERDFEDWIYCSADTLGIEGLAWSSSSRGLAEIKSALRPKAYSKPTMQAQLAHRMDVDLVRERSSSFDRMIRKFDNLVEHISQEGDGSTR